MVTSIASTYKKWHRWPGFILSFILLYFSLTGIVMNHREFFSSTDIPRKWMPNEYQYKNWNNAALKGDLILSPDSILVYGNIGIWVTDSLFTSYRPLNQGFPKGTDNRKIADVHHSANGHLYAATLLGLYSWDNTQNQWVKFHLPDEHPRFVALESKDDTIYALNRSFLFKGFSNGTATQFEKMELPAPEGYQNRVGMFETVWQIHSGEIFGIPGKLFVDGLGILTAFLSVTGIIYFLVPGWIKRRKEKNRKTKTLAGVSRWSLNWHNKIGAWFFVFLIVLFFTGMFLRPPLLIAIANARIAPVKFSHLDQPNPWYDKFRDLLWDHERGYFLLATSEGIFHFNPQLLQPIPFPNQPPVSVMGINTFEKYRDGSYLVGSFSGLFLWHPQYPDVFNYPVGSIYKEQAGGRPIGDFKVSGYLKDVSGNEYLAEYDLGLIPLFHQTPVSAMPKNMLEVSNLSLWSFSLEVHTGRIFQGLLGGFYILLVPLSGLMGIVVVLSGYLLWWKKFRRKKMH